MGALENHGSSLETMGHGLCEAESYVPSHPPVRLIPSLPRHHPLHHRPGGESRSGEAKLDAWGWVLASNHLESVESAVDFVRS